MYDEGYSAVFNLSNYSYNFPTHPDDGPFLGLVYPIFCILYTYYGQLMGEGNSPAITGQFGLLFARLLLKTYTVFQGEARLNC